MKKKWGKHCGRKQTVHPYRPGTVRSNLFVFHFSLIVFDCFYCLLYVSIGLYILYIMRFFLHFSLSFAVFFFVALIIKYTRNTWQTVHNWRAGTIHSNEIETAATRR